MLPVNPVPVAYVPTAQAVHDTVDDVPPTYPEVELPMYPALHEYGQYLLEGAVHGNIIPLDGVRQVLHTALPLPVVYVPVVHAVQGPLPALVAYVEIYPELHEQSAADNGPRVIDRLTNGLYTFVFAGVEVALPNEVVHDNWHILPHK